MVDRNMSDRNMEIYSSVINISVMHLSVDVAVRNTYRGWNGEATHARKNTAIRNGSRWLDRLVTVGLEGPVSLSKPSLSLMGLPWVGSTA